MYEFSAFDNDHVKLVLTFPDHLKFYKTKKTLLAESILRSVYVGNIIMDEWMKCA